MKLQIGISALARDFSILTKHSMSYDNSESACFVPIVRVI